ncbi:hypothetical protein [Paracoccus sp. (in: a-proteobacteria)]|uniref:hypothetical protein n=1 Tax=Paracoccus sp. TaxID=267 RepID=UPI0032205F00
MKKLLLVLLPLLGLALGAAGGTMLQPAATAPKTGPETAASGGAEAAPDAGHGAEAETAAAGHGADDGAGGLDWFKFPNQFFVPILRNGSADAVMILSLGLEIRASGRTDIESQEHRLRDALLSALMAEANTGAFDGNFTSDAAMQRLRGALLAAARNAAGPSVVRVLVEDIGRQAQ